MCLLCLFVFWPRGSTHGGVHQCASFGVFTHHATSRPPPHSIEPCHPRLVDIDRVRAARCLHGREGGREGLAEIIGRSLCNGQSTTSFCCLARTTNSLTGRDAGLTPPLGHRASDALCAWHASLFLAQDCRSPPAGATSKSHVRVRGSVLTSPAVARGAGASGSAAKRRWREPLCAARIA
jgi:hypothetical protein